jgi:hypothetical protein
LFGYENPPDIKKLGKTVLIFLIIIYVILPSLVLFFSFELISRYRLFSIPACAGLAIAAIVAIVFSYCKYAWNKKTIIGLLLVLIASTLILLFFQAAYSYAHIDSLKQGERISAFNMLLYVDEERAFNSYKEIFNKPKDDTKNPLTKKTFLFDMTVPLLKEEKKAEGLKPLWISGVDEKMFSRQAVSITMLSMFGENENLCNKILRRLEQEKVYKFMFPLYEWAERLILITPPEKREEMTLRLLQSENEYLKHIGYYCVQFFPSDFYFLPMLESLKQERREQWLDKANFTITTITLNDKIFMASGVLDVPKSVEALEKWYANRMGETFETRLDKVLEKSGHPAPLSRLSDEELFCVYKKEENNYKRMEIRNELIKILENNLKYRLKIIDGFTYFPGGKEKCDVYYAYTYLEIKKRVYKDRSIVYRLRHWLECR